MSAKDRFPKIFASVYAILMLALYAPRLFGIPWNGSFTNVQTLWDDFLFRSSREDLKPGDKRLILLAVDEETGRQYGFPLPRAVYARALDQMKALGVDIYSAVDS